MVDDYDGLDYSHSNPPPDPALKWETDEGIKAMLPVWNVAIAEIRSSIQRIPDTRTHTKVMKWAGVFQNYINLRPGASSEIRMDTKSGTRGAKSFVDWVQWAVPHEVPLFSMTFGQMFEEAIRNRGLHPYNSTRNQTFWTGTWMQEVKGQRPEQPYEGFGIVTRPHGWSVIYQEDRSKGLSMHMGGRIRTGRQAEKRPGVLVRTVNSNNVLQPMAWRPMWADAVGLNVYSNNMDVLHSPGSASRLDEYIHLYGNETYESAIQRIILLANAVADFMNDRDFHVLEELKRQIRRGEHARPSREGAVFVGYEKKVPKALLPVIGDAAVLSEQMHLGKRAYDLYKVFYTGNWKGEGWREVTTGLPETMDPDRVNLYYATKLGSYPVEEWEGMPVRKDGTIVVPEYFE